MRCPQCREENEEGSRFCVACGADFRKASAAAPSPRQQAENALRQANLERVRGRLHEAAAKARLAAELDPEDPYAYLLLAELAAQQRMYTEAAQFYAQVLALKPDLEKARVALEKLRPRLPRPAAPTPEPAPADEGGLAPEATPSPAPPSRPDLSRVPETRPLRTVLSVYEKAGYYLTRLERVQEQEPLEQSAYEEARGRYQTIQARAEAALAEVRKTIQARWVDQKIAVSTLESELANLELRQRVGELTDDQVGRQRRDLQARLRGAIARREELQTLSSAQSAAELGGVLEEATLDAATLAQALADLAAVPAAAAPEVAVTPGVGPAPPSEPPPSVGLRVTIGPWLSESWRLVSGNLKPYLKLSGICVLGTWAPPVALMLAAFAAGVSDLRGMSPSGLSTGPLGAAQWISVALALLWLVFGGTVFTCGGVSCLLHLLRTGEWRWDIVNMGWERFRAVLPQILLAWLISLGVGVASSLVAVPLAATVVLIPILILVELAANVFLTVTLFYGGFLLLIRGEPVFAAWGESWRRVMPSWGMMLVFNLALAAISLGAGVVLGPIQTVLLVIVGSVTSPLWLIPGGALAATLLTMLALVPGALIGYVLLPGWLGTATLLSYRDNFGIEPLPELDIPVGYPKSPVPRLAAVIVGALIVLWIAVYPLANKSAAPRPTPTSGVSQGEWWRH